MKGDFSRHTFDHTKHYSGVWMQQGRVQVDADWNEQQEINRYRVETETKDVIGQSGTPMDDDGFKIILIPKSHVPGSLHLADLTHFSLKDLTLRIGKGHYYVDGILCENEKDVSYDTHPNLPKQPDLLNPDSVAEALGDAPWGIVYLDVWQRHITALDDPHIHEVALGGPDTATRSQTVWQVKILPLDLPSEGLKVTIPEGIKILSPGERLLQKLDLLNLVSRYHDLAILEAGPEKVHEVRARVRKTSTNVPQFSEADRLEMEKIAEVLAKLTPQVTCLSTSAKWDTLIASSTGTLVASTIPPKNTEGLCIVPPSAGYLRLENQLYRVEIHHGSDSKGGPTFKWSRDNGSVVTLITGFGDNSVQVKNVGPDDILGFAPGQWAEIIDDERELKGEPGELVQIKFVDKDTCIITLESTPTPVKEELNPKLRRWNMVEASATKDGLSVSFNNWHELEDGIWVQFSQGTYKAGDYWLIPARTGDDIEWPQDNSSTPIPQPPQGITHHYCRLALLKRIGPLKFEVQDCRQRFPSLISNAMHVADVNWKNDDYFTLDQFDDGLEITFDRVPVQQAWEPISVAWMIVTLEMQMQMVGHETMQGAILSYILGGVVRQVQPETLKWSMVSTLLPNQESIHTFLIKNLKDLRIRPRVRVTLKGHTIWSEVGGKKYYLDGQAFGEPGKRVDGNPCTKLILPSGAGALASDFESWFYLCLPPLQVKSVEFIRKYSSLNTEFEHISSAGIITFPQASSQTVQFSETELINEIRITFNRDVSTKGIDEDENLQCIMVKDSRNNPVKGNIQFAKNKKNVVLFIATNPKQFAWNMQDINSGFTGYQLTILGKQTNNNPPATDDKYKTPLDGNFDTFPGEDFVLPFNVSARPPQVRTVRFIKAEDGGEGTTEGLKKSYTRPPLSDKPWIIDQLINAVEITFNFPVSSKGMESDGQLQCILLEGEQEKRIHGNIDHEGNKARFTVVDRPSLSVGSYRLTVCGVDRTTDLTTDLTTDSAVAVTAVDGKTQLDGEFTGKPGSDFVLYFKLEDIP